MPAMHSLAYRPGVGWPCSVDAIKPSWSAHFRQTQAIVVFKWRSGLILSLGVSTFHSPGDTTSCHRSQFHVETCYCACALATIRQDVEAH